MNSRKKKKVLGLKKSLNDDDFDINKMHQQILKMNKTLETLNDKFGGNLKRRQNNSGII